MSIEQIDRILHALDAPPDKYRRDEVEEAVALHEEITPSLLAILDELAADPEKFNDEAPEPNLGCRRRFLGGGKSGMSAAETRKSRPKMVSERSLAHSLLALGWSSVRITQPNRRSGNKPSSKASMRDRRYLLAPR